ncbi:MAG TPA: M1 family metallopeptidase [Acidimicrobiales bacterium]|nr:M1 family metallopeptidase [Acidimicrobiales bacterium]
MAAPASYRLPRTVSPVHYDLELTPDLPAARFGGRVEIAVSVHEPITELVLNAADLEVSSAVVRQGQQTWPATVTIDAEQQQATLALPETLAAGEATVTLEFTGVLNDMLRGFYRSTFTGSDGTEQVIATTQFEATDARRAFPCWDEPDFKATFAVTLIVPQELTAVSSGAQASDEPLGDGTRRVTFSPTMPMSTYVLAWVVGPLELTEPVDVDGVPLRLAAPHGRLPLTGFGLEVGAHALRFLAGYFGIPYPSDKLDHVAIPDFAFGAMENLGCVTYRETALLADPAQASQRELMRVTQVVCHETAHMWFGDLVTMKWWNGIWLNEAFATFMELKATEAYRPGWEPWTTFGAGRAGALNTDGLRATRPIEFPVGRPEEADAMFDILTYQKGGSVLRMLEQYLGEEVFRQGISRYLNEHAHANTETSDLWDALEAVSGEPVRATMDSWIFQGGHPVVEVAGSPGDTGVTLSQRRFLYAGDGSDEGHWAVPVILRAGVGGETVHRRALVDGPTEVDFGGPVDWVVANEGAWGFYRVAYSDALLAALRPRLAGELTARERLALLGDVWASVIAGTAPLRRWVGLVRDLGAEEDPDVWAAVAGPLSLLDTVVPDADRPALAAFVREVAGPAFAAIGWEPVPGESDRRAVARGQLVTLLGTVGADPAVRAEATTRMQRQPDDAAAIPPDLLTPVATVVAVTGGENAYEAILSRYRKAEIPQDKLRYLMALGGFPDAELLRRSLDLSLSDEVKNQDGVFVAATVIANRHGSEVGWSWLEDNWDEVVARTPPNLLLNLLQATTSFVDPGLVARAHALLSRPDLPVGGPRVAQYEERMDINVAFATRSAGDIAAAVTATAAE